MQHLYAETWPKLHALHKNQLKEIMTLNMKDRTTGGGGGAEKTEK